MTTNCYPAWHAKFAPLAAGAQITVFSGCALNTATGNIACAPETMRANAEAQLRRLAPGMFSGKLSLETYTLARYMQSEVGSKNIATRVAVGEAAVNQAKRRPGSASILNVLLYNQGSGHPNYGFYGPIHDTAAGCVARGLRQYCHPYKRWASTRLDPTVLTLLLADLIMTGQSGNFARGADDQSDMFNRGAYPDPVGALQDAARNGSYWVGPLPGVDHRHTFLMRKFGGLPAAQSAVLLTQGIAAVSSNVGPDWPANLPICSTAPTPVASESEPESSGAGKILAGFVIVGGLASLSWLTWRAVKRSGTALSGLGCLPPYIRKAKLQPLHGFASVIQERSVHGSEGVAPFFFDIQKDDPEYDIATYFDLARVTAADVKQGRREIRRATQRSLRERGVPARMTVYRYGDIKRRTNVTSVTSVSLDPGVAVRGPAKDPVFVCELDRAQVLADIPAITYTDYLEEELLVRPNDLQNCRKVSRQRLRTADRDFCAQHHRRAP
jgi:hypothetical protein